MSQGDYELLTAVEDAGGRFVLDATEVGRADPAGARGHRSAASGSAGRTRADLLRLHPRCLPTSQRPNVRLAPRSRSPSGACGESWSGATSGATTGTARCRGCGRNLPCPSWSGKAPATIPPRPCRRPHGSLLGDAAMSRNRAAHHARRVGPALYSPAGRRALRTGLRRAAGPPRRGRQLAPAQAPYGQFARGASPLEFPALRRRAAPSGPQGKANGWWAR